MITLDANLLARLLLRDHAQQQAPVRQLLEQPQDFTAPVTVMLELVWVLEVNGCSADDIVQGLTLLLGLPNFEPAHPEALRRALQWYRQGMDFADALHLALSRASQQGSTFDKTFAIKTGLLGAAPEVVAL